MEWDTSRTQYKNPIENIKGYRIQMSPERLLDIKISRVTIFLYLLLLTFKKQKSLL